MGNESSVISLRNGHIGQVIYRTSPVSHSKHIRNPVSLLFDHNLSTKSYPSACPRSLSLFQCSSLGSQDLCPELPERGIDSLLALGIAHNGPVGRVAAGQQTELSTKEEASGGEKSVRGEITKRGGLQERSEVGNGLCRGPC